MKNIKLKEKKNNKNGFTLVELLAVIVILAVILVIAVPKVMSVIEDAKKATLESTAKMIADAAEKAKIHTQVLGKTDEITCDSVAKINDVDYKSCNITFDNSTALVTIKGSGKFEGLYVCNGTKINSTATNESCTLVSVTIDLLGGKDNVDYEEKYESGSEVTLDTPTREGYSFMGWNVTGDSASIADGILKVGNTPTKATAIWEEYSEDYPVLLDGPTIYNSLGELGLRDYITEFEFVDSYTLTGNESEPLDASNSQDGSILVYVVPISNGIKMVVAGNGSGGILLNQNSGAMFYELSNLKVINGMELLRWVNVTENTAMFNHTAIESINLGNARIIGTGIFKDCENLTNIIIPNSVTSIGNSAFSNCTSLTSIEIPNSVTSIGDYAFSDCTSLTSVTIGNSVTSIGDYAFSDCTSLTSIAIPNSVTSIGDHAFSGCTSLTSVEIPNSVKSIGKSAFSGCDGLTKVEIPNSVTSIGDSAFSGCDNLTNVYYSGKEEDWNKITIDANGNDRLTNATKHYEYVGE